MLGLLDEQGTGLAITLDEIHGADRDELAHLAASVQHFIRAGLPVALVFAGLPAAVSDLLDEGVATFLRRADRIDLHAAAIDEVEVSFREVFGEAPYPIDLKLLRTAAEATGGYPFLIQLVGYHLWQVAESAGQPLGIEDIELAVSAARRRNTRMVIDAALASATPKDLDFLRAMAEDDGTSRIADVRNRLGDARNTVGNYRARLIDAGLIESVGHGLVDFAIPGFREHLRT